MKTAITCPAEGVELVDPVTGGFRHTVHHRGIELKVLVACVSSATNRDGTVTLLRWTLQFLSITDGCK